MLCTQSASTLELIDDAQYTSEAEEANKNSYGNPILVLVAAEKYVDARMYDVAESLIADLIKKYGATHAMMYSSLSVVQGKQGKFAEAMSSIDKALAMDPNSMHTKLVKASWLFETGKAADASQLVASVPVPATGAIDHAMYWGCMACYNASTGNESEMEKAMKKVLEAKDKDGERFLRRDVVFDKYRSRTWYVDLFGNTVKK